MTPLSLTDLVVLVLVLVLVQIDLRLEESPDRCMPKALIDYHR